jgi:hypothetical protein
VVVVVVVVASRLLLGILARELPLTSHHRTLGQPQPHPLFLLLVAALVLVQGRKTAGETGVVLVKVVQRQQLPLLRQRWQVLVLGCQHNLDSILLHGQSVHLFQALGGVGVVKQQEEAGEGGAGAGVMEVRKVPVLVGLGLDLWEGGEGVELHLIASSSSSSK